MSSEKAPDELSETLARMGGVLFSEQTLDAILDLILSLTIEAVDPVGAASITLRNATTAWTSNSSSERAVAVDQAQYESNRGPCLTASRTGDFLDVRLEPDDPRWPEFARSAKEHGISRSISVPLFVGENVGGALNLYSGEGVPDEKDLAAIRLLGQQASIVLSNALAFTNADRVNDQLRDALVTRERIGQATGILMAREAIGAEEAFDVLRRASQRSNRKLRDIAQEVVDQNLRRGR